MDKHKLKRFIQHILNSEDTPDLIQWIADDQDRMLICFAIMQTSGRTDAAFKQVLNKNCQDLGISVSQLRMRIAPVARGLGIATNDTTVDYYAVLGVPAGADEAQIRSAFRSQAHRLHPDKSRYGDAHTDDFITLT